MAEAAGSVPPTIPRSRQATSGTDAGNQVTLDAAFLRIANVDDGRTIDTIPLHQVSADARGMRCTVLTSRVAPPPLPLPSPLHSSPILLSPLLCDQISSVKFVPDVESAPARRNSAQVAFHPPSHAFPMMRPRMTHRRELPDE